MGRRVPVAQRIAKVLVVGGLPDAQQHAQVLRRHVACPPHRRRLAALRDDRAVHAELLCQVLRLAAQDGNVVADGVVGHPAVLPQVLVRMCRVLVLLIEKGLLVLGVGETPGDVLVVPDQDDRRSRDAHAGYVIARRVHGELEPDGGQRQVKVGIAGHQPSACRALESGECGSHRDLDRPHPTTGRVARSAGCRP